MLNIQNLTYLQGGIPLLQNVNLQAFTNQRIGLVGKNGCGKSTLFRLIRGEIKPDGGDISMQSGKTIAFVEQEIASSDQPALEFVLDGDTELRLLEKTLAQENTILPGSMHNIVMKPSMVTLPRPELLNCSMAWDSRTTLWNDPSPVFPGDGACALTWRER